MALLGSRTELTAAATADLMHIVDVSDTSSAASGTSKKVTFDNLQKSITEVGTSTALLQAIIDNLTIDGNSITVTDTNGNLTIIPNGTGHLDVFDPPSSESTGINVNGTTYDSCLRLNDIGLNAAAQLILHKHSTTTAPILVGARSNSDTDSHAAVTASQDLLALYATGWTGSHYDIFGYLEFGVDSSGTISSTSSPGRMGLYITPDGSNTATLALEVSNDGSMDFQDNVVSRQELKDYAESVQDVTAATTTDFDLTSGNVINLSQATDITTLTFSNPSASGSMCSFTLVRTKDATATARSITWPAAVKWDQGVSPTLSSSASAVDIFSFMTIDGGTTWYGFVGGQAFA